MKTAKKFASLIGVSLCTMTLVSGCEPGDTDRFAQEDGADVFDQNCSDCHGPDGRGPSLATIRALASADLRSRIQNHPTAGQIPQRLPAAQIGPLIEFLEQELPEPEKTP